MIRALIFDFDGLILDTETPLIESYRVVHEKHGVPFVRDAFLRQVGHAEYAFDPWHGFSPHADRAALEEERRAIKTEMLSRLTVLPGVVALLEAGRRLGLRIGLASNSEHTWVEPHLDRIGLRGFFEFLACRGDAPSPKPEPDLYRLVLSRFGLRGHEAIAFEDSQTGILAAKRANVWVVAAPGPSTSHHDFSKADLKVTSLAQVELEALVQRWGSREEKQ
jgi:HAD superfamily hydrolase (TIGR01509 family)